MRRRGTVLIAVMVVMALAAVLAASLLYRMRAEVKASSVTGRGEQAYEAALSGLARTITVLRAHAAEVDVWYENPDLFYNQPVVTEGADRWYFTVYAENPLDPAMPRYGLTDESSKLNINEADLETLLKMPNMTAELAGALIDYRDADSDPQPQGAEQEYYSQLKRPYLIRNGPPATIEELLLVKGFNGTIVYGEDANLNGLLDPNEDDGDKTFPPDDADGRLNTGLRGVATTYSAEPKTDPDAASRVDLNGDVAALQGIGLSDQTIQYITFYRAEGNAFKHPSELLEAQYTLKQAHPEAPDLQAGATIESGVGAAELPLVMEKLAVKSAGTQPSTTGTTPSRRGTRGTSASGAGADGQGPNGSPGESGPVLDDPAAGGESPEGAPPKGTRGGPRGRAPRPGNSGAAPAARGPDAAGAAEGTAEVASGASDGSSTSAATKPAAGRVNVNTAPAAVLALLPGIDEGLAGQIVDVRRGLESEAKSNIAWLYTRNLVDADTFKVIAPRLATRGYQFHVMCVGFGVPCGRYRVIEAVVDMSGGTPRVVYLRDITRLGMPFALTAEP